MSRRPDTPEQHAEAIVRNRATTLARRGAFAADPTDPRHGTSNGYSNLKCRCDRCRAANRESMFEYLHHPEHPERLENKRTKTAKARAAAKK